MLNIELIIFCFILLETNIKSGPITNCELNSYCGNKKYKCSIYGNCNYRIFEYYSDNQTIDPYDYEAVKDDYIVCECNKGYSSFGIDTNSTTDIYCCFSKKSQLTAFLLELFIGFGTGHFYLGNITFATIKMLIQIFLCVGVGCVTYFSCIREHPFQTNLIEVNNNENLGKNVINENKNNENNKENEINEENDDKGNENMIDNKNNESKDESFELEENKENERMFQNFISCPKSKFFIYFSIISFFLFNFIDVVLIAFGVFKDKYGEELYLGS